MKRWLTGDRVIMPDEDIERELFETARNLMALSGLRKTPGLISNTDFEQEYNEILTFISNRMRGRFDEVDTDFEQ